MTRSPLLAALFALVPLVVLAFPLSRVLNPPPVVQKEQTKEEAMMLRADVILRAAHPFEKVTINEVTFSAGEEEKEITFNSKEPLNVFVQWPEGIAESALFIEVMADHQELKSHTLWGFGSASEALNFQWSHPE